LDLVMGSGALITATEHFDRAAVVIGFAALFDICLMGGSLG